MKRKSILLALLALLVGVLAVTAAGCGGDGGGDGEQTGAEQQPADEGEAVEPLPSSSCGELEFEGEGEPNAIIVSDLPLQGSSRSQTIQMTEAIRMVLHANQYNAGDLHVRYQSCDVQPTQV